MNNSSLARRRPAPVRSAGAIARPAPVTSPKIATSAPVEARTPTPRNGVRPMSKSLSVRTATYARADLDAIAQIAHHYLVNGANDLAQTLVEGLVEVAPNVSHYRLMLGLVLHHQGDSEGALDAYRTAAKIDPSDARALINWSEILIREDRTSEAKVILVRARDRADSRKDALLLRKANGLLSHLDRLAERASS
jgi:Flp pilus assembly protein TadD